MKMVYEAVWQILEKRRWTCQECNNGIGDHDLKGQLFLRTKLKSDEIF
jgi:hypothetical protein